MQRTRTMVQGLGSVLLGSLFGCYVGMPAGAGGSSAADGDGGSDGAAEAGESGADDSTGDPAVDCEMDVGATPLRRLTRREYANAVRDLLDVSADVTTLDPDEKLAAFDSNLAAPVSPSIVIQYRALAEDVALAAMPTLADIVPCVPAEVAGDPALAAVCTQDFARAFGRRAFRRTLTDAEVQTYAALGASGSDFADGIRLVVAGMLQSVHFLYHLELGPTDAPGEIVALDGFQLASRLSFFLWGSIPDDALLDAAEAGTLADEVELRAQAERLLADPRASDAVASFHLQWLGLDEPSQVTKTAEIYPAFDDTLRAAMWAETERFVSHVVLEGDGRLQTLMTSSESFVQGPLATLYGVTPSADPDEPVALDPNERAGLLTQASFLATHAHVDSSGPVQRGVTVRSNVLCQPPPPPPNDVPDLPPIDPDATTRERFEQHSTDPACSGCHLSIDGIGLAMENYDGLGGYRTQENGIDVDASGNLLGTDVDGPFVGAVELAHKLGDSQTVRDCVATQWFRFAFGRGETTQDECTMANLTATFADADADVRELMIAIVTSDAFRNRKA